MHMTNLKSYDYDWIFISVIYTLNKKIIDMPTECVFKRYFESILKIFFSSHKDFVLSIKYVFKNLFSKNVPCYENEWK